MLSFLRLHAKWFRATQGRKGYLSPLSPSLCGAEDGCEVARAFRGALPVSLHSLLLPVTCPGSRRFVGSRAASWPAITASPFPFAWPGSLLKLRTFSPTSRHRLRFSFLPSLAPWLLPGQDSPAKPAPAGRDGRTLHKVLIS